MGEVTWKEDALDSEPRVSGTLSVLSLRHPILWQTVSPQGTLVQKIVRRSRELEPLPQVPAMCQIPE